MQDKTTDDFRPSHHDLIRNSLLFRIIRTMKLRIQHALCPLIFHIEKQKEPAINYNKNKRTLKVKPDYFLFYLQQQFNPERQYKLELTDKKYADYYFVADNDLNNLLSYCNPKRTLVYHGEPLATSKKFTEIWKKIHKEDAFYVSRMPDKRMFTIWHLSKDYHSLNKNSIQKTKAFSTIISDKISSRRPNYSNRLQFLKILDKEISIDIYGKTYRLLSPLKKLRQYCGRLPSMIKDEGLFPYKYHFAAESSIEDNYFTEKLTDAILAECLCFYSGTETAKNWIDSQAFIQIDITKPTEAIKAIKQAIENNEWEKRIEVIRKEKQKILNEMTLLDDIERVIRNEENVRSS